MSNILAIDIGGTKTLLACFGHDGTVLESTKFPTPQDYNEFLNQLKHSVTELQTKKGRRCVCAVPGRLDRANGVAIAFGNLPWQNVPIKHGLEDVLGVKVTLESDSKLAGLSEAHLLRQYRKVLYITVSTGIGGVMVIGGKIDHNNQDAEYGHMLLEHEGRLQRWEEFASGKAIFEKLGKRASDITDAGEWYIIARNIAVGLIDVIAATTPDVIVIGGGVGSHFAKFGGRLIEELQLYEDPLLHVPPVVGAQRAEEAVIYGCYILANQ